MNTAKHTENTKMSSKDKLHVAVIWIGIVVVGVVFGVLQYAAEVAFGMR